jgi:hypothetical protein
VHDYVLLVKKDSLNYQAILPFLDGFYPYLVEIILQAAPFSSKPVAPNDNTDTRTR